LMVVAAVRSIERVRNSWRRGTTEFVWSCIVESICQGVQMHIFRLAFQLLYLHKSARMPGVDARLQYVHKVPDFRALGMDRSQDVELQVQA
jgi:hypothetical protein